MLKLASKFHMIEFVFLLKNYAMAKRYNQFSEGFQMNVHFINHNSNNVCLNSHLCERHCWSVYRE